MSAYPPNNPISLQVFVFDASKIKLWNLRISVTYLDYPTNPGAFKDFSIDVKPGCQLD